MTAARVPLADPASYDVAGPEGAAAIVFIHGTRLSRAMWSAQLGDLADTYRVAATDLPGHGALVDRPFDLDAAADQVAGVIAAIAPARDLRAVVVGLSLGGYVGMHLVGRRPELVRGLVLSGSTAEPVAWRSIPYRGLAVVMERFAGERLDALNRWFFRTRFPPDIAEPIVAGGFWYAGGATALRSLVGRSFVAPARRLRRPDAAAQRDVGPAIPPLRPDLRAGGAATAAGAAGRCHAPRQPGPAARVQRRHPAVHDGPRGGRGAGPERGR